MIRFRELKEGNIIITTYNGQLREGFVTDLNASDKQICVNTGEQEFWYNTEDIFPSPLDNKYLLRLGFKKDITPNNLIKYSKGPFRILLQLENNFSEMEVWYREDRRINPEIHYVHQLQNHYKQMTKVELLYC